MLKLLISIVSLQTTEAADPIPPPSTGRSFYKPLLQDQISGRFFCDISLGSEKSEHGLWLTTLESNIGVGSSECTRCNFTNTWNHSLSTTATLVSENESEEMYYINEKTEEHNELKDVILKGKLINDQVFICQDNDKMNKMANIFAITNPGGVIINSTLDGYLGLAPYPSEPDGENSHNFMWGLKNNSLIDHNVFSIYINTNTIDSSIKFGSYDPDGLASKFVTIETINSKSWAVYMDQVNLTSVGSGESISGSRRELHFDPMMTYIYVPKDDFNLVSTKLNSMYSDINCNGGYCNFDTSCKDALSGFMKGDRDDGWTLGFEINHYNGTTLFDDALNVHHLFIPGEQLELSPDSCYFGIVRNNEGNDQDKWFMGQIIMQNYYFTYDMTPYDEMGEDYITLSIGVHNPQGLPSINTKDCDSFESLVKRSGSKVMGKYAFMDNVILFIGLGLAIMLIVVGCLVIGSRKLQAVQEQREQQAAKGMQYQPMSAAEERKVSDDES